MGAKTSPEMLAALDLVRGGMSPLAAVDTLAARGMSISRQAIYQHPGFKLIDKMKVTLRVDTETRKLFSYLGEGDMSAGAEIAASIAEQSLENQK